MCGTCGCDQINGVKIVIPSEDTPKKQEIKQHDGHSHDHEHRHHDHSHSHDHSHQKLKIDLEQDILHKNNLLAERNRGFFQAKNIVALNLVSSPGSGKTTLLEKTITGIGDELDFAVIEGDQQTMQDANRIAKTGAKVVQINTGTGCHLESEMVNNALEKLQPNNNSTLIIENVGNLVCPAMFDLGENFRVVIMSVTEGEDKPLKYPTMFESANICIINKTDLLPYVDFDVEKAKEYALRINHHLEFFELSATKGDGMDKWFDWLREKNMIVTP